MQAVDDLLEETATMLVVVMAATVADYFDFRGILVRLASMLVCGSLPHGFSGCTRKLS